jgi:Ni/Co efflux regulator RcnB
VAPGHERRWSVGQRLPRNVVFYNLEPQVLSYLGPPPPRQRYVRVASDILLIATGTGMVLDAIDDLDRY